MEQTHVRHGGKGGFGRFGPVNRDVQVKFTASIKLTKLFHFEELTSQVCFLISLCFPGPSKDHTWY